MLISGVYGGDMKPPKRPRKKPTEEAAETSGGKSILVTGIDERLDTLLKAASTAEDRSVVATIRHAARLYVNRLLKEGIISLSPPSAKVEEAKDAAPTEPTQGDGRSGVPANPETKVD